MPDERTGSTRHPRGRGRRLEVDHVTVVDRKPMRTAIAGAVVGNGMEWYDFGIYGYLTATVAIVSTIVLTVPAYLMMANPSLVWVSMLMLAFSVTFYVAISASALPALFPTASRYGAMAIAYNISVSLFGGTAPMIGELLVKVTGITIAPAFYTIAFAVFGGIALLTMKESAGRPLPGSMPTVGSSEEAQDLVDTQEANPRLDVADLPFEEHDAATAALADANGDSRTDA